MVYSAFHSSRVGKQQAVLMGCSKYSGLLMPNQAGSKVTVTGDFELAANWHDGPVDLQVKPTTATEPEVGLLSLEISKLSKCMQHSNMHCSIRTVMLHNHFYPETALNVAIHSSYNIKFKKATLFWLIFIFVSTTANFDFTNIQQHIISF